MNLTKTDTLRVPGAGLYYQARGSGPLLILLAGGAGDADSYHILAEKLVDRYTVVTYDRRGYSRSPLDDTNQTIEIWTHSDDVHRILAEIGSAPAYVMGCSIGLDLAMRHPEQVRTLVAHEPPLVVLLSEDEKTAIQKNQQEVADTLRRDGATAAIQKMASSVGVNADANRTKMGMPQQSLQSAALNQASFFKYDAGAVARYQPDLDALRDAPTRIVVAAGEQSREAYPYRCAEALANALGTPLVAFPGNHAGFVSYPQEFADRLREALEE